jgi:hypothetical protein
MATISTKEAVAQAKSVLRELYDDDPPRDLALEEIELVDVDQRKAWAVTLGFHRPRKVTAANAGASIYELVRNQPVAIEHRVYKTLVIDAESGAFLKMDIRQVQ